MRGLVVFALVSGPAWAAPALPGVGDGVSAGTVEAGQRYHVVRIDLREVSLELVGQGARGHPRNIEGLDAVLAREGRVRVAATNAGMFHAGAVPVGLHVEGGQILQPLEIEEGAGNFFLKPNAVFWVDDAGAHVGDAATWAPTPGLRIATQSGPALVLGGALHPKFTADSPSSNLRSAVCVSDPQTVWLILSEGAVRFHELAVFARDGLGCADALYLDGVISGLWAPGLPATATAPGPFSGFLVVSAPTL